MKRILVSFFLMMACCTVFAVSTEMPTKPGPLFKDLSKFHTPINANPLAQRYFDQGLLLFYGFDFGESVRSFQPCFNSV